MEQFYGLFQVALPRMLSDHRPVKLATIKVDWGPRPFRVENCWFLHKEFLRSVREWWEQMNIQGFVGFRIVKKLQCLKGKIKVLNREVFGKLETSRSCLFKEFEFWDLMEERGLS